MTPDGLQTGVGAPVRRREDQRLLCGRLGGLLRLRLLRASRLGLRLNQFERLVVLDFLLNPLLKSHQRQLQNLHRLDHAGRKHLLLRHPHFLPERHPHRH